MRLLSPNSFLVALLLACATPVAAQSFAPPSHTPHANPNDPGILDPILVELAWPYLRVPASHQVEGNSELLNIVGTVKRKRSKGEQNATGTTVDREQSPNTSAALALADLEDAARNNRMADMQAAASRLEAIVMGTTQGDIFDGFALLNHNRGAWLPDQVAGEFKMKRLSDSGKTAPGPDGQLHRIWEATVNILWYDDEADSDTHLLVVPASAHEFDSFRIHYNIYSTVRDDFSPSVHLRDYRTEGSTSLPFKGFDATWVGVFPSTRTEVSIQYPSIGLVDSLFSWGWRAKPWRTTSIQLVRELVNAHHGGVELEPRGRSLAERNRALSVADIGAAAPEKKFLDIAQMVSSGASPSAVHQALTQSSIAPLGNWIEWLTTAHRRDRIPPEAWETLVAEGITPNADGSGDLSPYDLVVAIANEEFYILKSSPAAQGAALGKEERLASVPGARMRLKVVNLDEHTHYLNVEEFGPPLHSDLRDCWYAPGGEHALEIYNRKPIYGAPKAFEMQWRAGWGFRPGLDVIEQFDVFPRPLDQRDTLAYRDGHGALRSGWLTPADLRGGDFRFDPPPEAIGSEQVPSPDRLREADGSAGLLVGRTTPGFGVAKMCDHPGHPIGSWCQVDRSYFNPYGIRNYDLDGDDLPDVLWFPPWLRNPEAQVGGDLILSTLAWEPFLYLHPDHGGLLKEPLYPAQGWWVDQTFAHGEPIGALSSSNKTVVTPRGLPQALFLSDGLFRDNGMTILPIAN